MRNISTHIFLKWFESEKFHQSFSTPENVHSVFLNKRWTKNTLDDILSAMRENDLGKDAVIIGEVTDKHAGIVALKTGLGANRIVDMPVGEQLPRIC